MELFKKRGPYQGRLTFDPDTETHTDLEGNKVVTDDAGKTWRYASKADRSHNARYQTRVLVVDATTPDAPHHNEPQPGDRHFDGVQSHPDEHAVTVTGHTEAYR